MFQKAEKNFVYVKKPGTKKSVATSEQGFEAMKLGTYLSPSK